MGGRKNRESTSVSGAVLWKVFNRVLMVDGRHSPPHDQPHPADLGRWRTATCACFHGQNTQLLSYENRHAVDHRSQTSTMDGQSR